MSWRTTRWSAAAIILLGACSARADWSIDKRFTAWTSSLTSAKYRYVIAFPGCIGVDDVASSWRDLNACLAGADGLVNTYDAICVLSTHVRYISEQFDLTSIDTTTCALRTTSWQSSDILGVITFGVEAEVDPSRAYLVTVRAMQGTPMIFSGTLAGPCLPHAAARTIEASHCLADLIPNPPDSRLRSADEILCGERDVDWHDANGDGKPDTCPNGLFDGTHVISVSTWDMDPTTNPATDFLVVVRLVQWVPPVGLVFMGVDFAVPPGDGVYLRMTGLQSPRVWDPPIDPLACR